MKFRLKVGDLYGHQDPASSAGRSYGMYMVPWIKAIKADLGLGLKEAKTLADTLRDSIESSEQRFDGAYLDVDIKQFPFLERHLWKFGSDIAPSRYIEVVREPDPSECLYKQATDGRSIGIIKEAMCKLIEISAWKDVRRLSEVLMDIEDEQSV